jgi:hypothetical protein
MKLKIKSGLPGCGKTTDILVEMIEIPGRYIFALPRIDLITEQKRDLVIKSQDSPTRPVIRAIHSSPSRRVPVFRQITEAIVEHRDHEHVILLISHEGMMGADLSDLAGWHVRIDEVPAAVLTDKVRAEAGVIYLRETYALDPIPGTNWSRLRVRDEAPGTKKILRDDVLKGLVSLDKRVRSAHGVYVDVQDWADLRERGRRLQWWSVWTPLQLRTAESVMIAGASYHHSLLARVTEALYPGQIKVEEVHIVGQPRQPRRVFIHYFTHGHRGSSIFWQDKGRPCLVMLCRYLEPIPLGFWSGNKVVREYFFGRLAGEMVQPKTEGTNSLMQHTSCAFIYSAKMLPSDQPLIDLFELSREEIERARETEDVIQFAWRGDLRNPASSDDYHIHLYDRHQAEALAQYLIEQEVGTIELVPVEEAGLLGMQRPGRGRPSLEPEDPRGCEERRIERQAKDRERQKRKRDREREQKLSSGTYQGRGRPRKERCAPDQPGPS